MLDMGALTGFEYKNVKSFDPHNCTKGSYYWLPFFFF